jgi:hypothetical protein
MRVPLEVWETVAVIINNEFVDTGEPITAKVLVQLVVGVNEDYHEEQQDG